MNYLKENKNYLKTYRNDIFNKIKAYEKNNNRYSSSIIWDETYQEIVVRKLNAEVYLHSIYDQSREIEKLVDKKPKYVEQIMLFGLPNVKQVPEILKYFVRVKRVFILVPSIGVFYKWMQYNLFEDLIQAFSLVEEFICLVDDSFDNIKHIVKALFDVGQHEKIVLLPFISYNQLYGEFFLNVCQYCKDALIDKDIMYVTRKHWRNAWLVHNLNGLMKNMINLQEIQELFVNNTCIVVAAGASLNKNIQLLKDVGNKAIIIAAGSAIDILHNNGIRPHFHIGVDGGELNEQVYRSVKASNVPLICSYSFYMPLLDEYTGTKFAFLVGAMDQNAAYLCRNFPKPLLKSTGGLSVVNVAHAIAVNLGCRKIVFMGQDCCYTDGKLHADGAWSEDNKYGDIPANAFASQDINGNSVYTNNIFLSLNRAIAGFVRSNPECKFINATEGGLPIEGARNMSMNDVIKKELKGTMDIGSFINNVINVYENKHKEEIRNILNQEMTVYKSEMLELQELLKKQAEYLVQINCLLSEQENYDIVKRVIDIMFIIQDKQIFKKIMVENFVFDINEALMLDIGEYSYELSDALEVVNDRLQDYLKLALVMADEYCGQVTISNKVMYSL